MKTTRRLACAALAAAAALSVAGAAWAADNPQSWYSPGPEGYTDYPALVDA